MTSSQVKAAVAEAANPEKAKFLQRYFKTGKGEYGEGDVFAGLTVPQSRIIAKHFKELPLEEVSKLITSVIHEERLIALFILIAHYKKAKENNQKRIVDFYLEHLKHVNNWDLVDSSAQYLLGNWLLTRPRSILYSMAKSESVWERRVAIISTYEFILNGEYEDTFALTRLLLKDSHDLIHKASGWMLREVGKRISMEALRTFLANHVKEMPRTALRYAIEKMPAPERKYWLSL